MVFDLHNDFPTVLDPSETGEYISSVIVDALPTAVIWTSGFDSAAALDTVEKLTASLRSYAFDLPVAIEDLGFLCEECVETFDFDRYFYCSLTWNGNNAFAGGALDDGTFTALGKRIVGMMNGRCAVDLAHLNKNSFFDVLSAAKHPMCSHTGFNSHPRSLDGDMIKALIARGGVIGLSAVTTFTDAVTAAGLAHAVDSFVCRYGIDNLCIGTDFFGSCSMPIDFYDYDCVPRLKCELDRLGYGAQATEKILYGNAWRFYKEICNERHL